jgi:hypothetical protein
MRARVLERRRKPLGVLPVELGSRQGLLRGQLAREGIQGKAAQGLHRRIQPAAQRAAVRRRIESGGGLAHWRSNPA